MKIPEQNHRGFFAVGIENAKTIHNVGTLWRSADLFGAAFMFTIGNRYKRQSSDTMKSWKNTPLFEFKSVRDLIDHLPYDCMLIGVELDESSSKIKDFWHPPRAVYLLGAEDSGLKKDSLEMCHRIIQLPGRRSMNVSVAGSIVLYDRYVKLSD